MATYVTDITCFLGEDGRLGVLPGPARRLADYFGAIVVSLATSRPETPISTDLQCRRRPGRRPCGGRIQGLVNLDHVIEWRCPKCDDNGFISGWQGTLWDPRPSGPLQ